MVDLKPPVTAEGTTLVRQLLSIAKSTRMMLSLKLAPLGLSVGHDELLMSLRLAVPVSLSQLSEGLILRMTTLSSAIDRLVSLGLLEFADDGRKTKRTMVKLTDSGLSTRTQVEAIWLEIGRDFTSELGVVGAEDMSEQLAVADAALGRQLSKLL